MQRATGIRIYEGAVAIVTGAGSGIGKALSEAISVRGAEVVVADVNGDCVIDAQPI